MYPEPGRAGVVTSGLARGALSVSRCKNEVCAVSRGPERSRVARVGRTSRPRTPTQPPAAAPSPHEPPVTGSCTRPMGSPLEEGHVGPKIKSEILIRFF